MGRLSHAARRRTRSGVGGRRMEWRRSTAALMPIAVLCAGATEKDVISHRTAVSGTI
jgi:hypothetical protein